MPLGFRVEVWGSGDLGVVSARGPAGAASTQARALNCTSPPPLGIISLSLGFEQGVVAAQAMGKASKGRQLSMTSMTVESLAFLALVPEAPQHQTSSSNSTGCRLWGAA